MSSSSSSSSTSLEPYFETLRAQGYVVIPNILTSAQCTSYKTRMWDWLEDLGLGTSRKDPDTWKAPTFPMTQHGIIAYPSLSHTQFIWDVRTEPNVMDVFAKLWNTDDLLVGFCRASVYLPQQTVATKDWLHIDQSSTEPNLECYQGAVNLADQKEPDSAGFMVLPFSHLYHADFFKDTQKESKGDGYMHAPEDTAWFEQKDPRCKRTFVPVTEGSITLWDSRCVHWNRSFPKSKASLSISNALPLANVPEGRYAIFVSMTPRTKVKDPKVIKRKREAFENRRSTNHWGHKVTYFPKKPHARWPKDIQHLKYIDQRLQENERVHKKIKESTLLVTPAMKKLAGF